MGLCGGLRLHTDFCDWFFRLWVYERLCLYLVCHPLGGFMRDGPLVFCCLRGFLLCPGPCVLLPAPDLH